MKLLVILFSICFSASTFAQVEIAYTEREGWFWIHRKDHSPTFGMTANHPISESLCEETETFLKGPLVSACKRGSSTCDKEFLADFALKRAFGRGFKTSRKPRTTSQVDWLITSELDGLDPQQIDVYAAQLGIDPQLSVVQSVNPATLAQDLDEERPVIFRVYEKGQPGGNSWYFRHEIGMLLQTEEDKELENTIYHKKSTTEPNAIQLTSRFLNCELQDIPEEHVYLPFNFTIQGRRHVSVDDAAVAYRAAAALAEMQFPESTSAIEKSILYGFELSQRIDAKTLKSIGLKNLVNHMFAIKSDKVKVKTYESIYATQEAMSVVGTVKMDNGYLKMAADRSGRNQ